MDFLYCCLPSTYNSIPCGYDKEEEIWKKNFIFLAYTSSVLQHIFCVTVEKVMPLFYPWCPAFDMQ